MMKMNFLLLLVLLGMGSFANAQTLSAGDIAFIGYNTDGTDDFSWIALTDIPAGEIIYFTEEGWNDVTSGWAGTTEGHMTYTAPAGGLTCGTVVHIDETSADVFTVSGGGTAVIATGSWSLASGDQVLAYYAATPEPATVPTFISGVNGDDGNGTPLTLNPTNFWNDAELTPLGTARSELPPGLTNGVNCVSLYPAVGTELDNAKYTGTLTGTSTTLRALINDQSNWSKDDVTPFAIAPGDYAPAVTCLAACADPDVPTLSATPSVACPGSSATITITGNLNDATQWVVYTGSCGGTQIGTTASGSFVVSPSATTTYFIRGEGGCVTPGTCGTVTITVQDNTNPIISCPPDQNYNVSGCSIIMPDVTGMVAVSDNCDPSPVVTQSPVAGTVVSLGTTNITLTATDASGNSANCNFNVTVNDTTLPTAVCQNITVYLDGTGAATITAADVDGGSFDNCSLASISASPTTFTCANIGANNVTLTATDSQGNTNSCVAVVTVVDSTAPTAVCQNITVFLNGSGTTFITPGDVDAGSTDNCSTAGSSVSPAVFTCANVGANNVTYTITDGSGNSNSCTSTVTVVDSTAPTAVCQNITVYLDGSGNATITGGDVDGGSTDNCSIASTSVTPSAFTCANIGANTVLFTVTDASGNTNSCTSTVTVVDSTAPSAVCQNLTVYLDGAGNATITAGDVDGGSTDNCGLASLSISQSSFTCANIGANSVTLTATDNSGNSAACVGVVTVTDTTGPVITCPGNQTLSPNISCQASLPDYTGLVSSSDNCGGVTVSQSPAPGTTISGSTAVTMTATDASGNSASCGFTVTLNDTALPSAVCQNITVYLDGSGNATITAGDVDGGSTDNCAIASMNVTPSAFTCANIGANTVTLTVTDINANTASCIATVTVVDSTAPAAACQNLTVYLDGSGNASITSGDVDAGSTDNCGIASYSVSPSAFTCADAGANTVTLTVTDNSGNTNTCTSTVTVIDSTAPAASCQNLTVYLDGSGNASITAGDVDAGSTDNCSLAALSVTPSAFTCANIGANTVTLTATDVSGNTNTCTSTVTVVDSTAPTAVCQNITVYLDGSGNATITAADIDGGSTDNCGSVSLAASQTAFTCANIGANTVSLTVTDGSGNTDVCVSTVTVSDTTSPVITCPGDQNETPDPSCTFTLPDYTGLVATTDNCGTPTVTQSPIAGTVISADATITMTSTDAAGNTSMCTFDVLLGTTPTQAVCQDVTVYLDGSGNASITASDIDGGSTATCGGTLSLSASQTSFTCADATIGATPMNNLVISGVYDAPLTGGLPKGTELYVIDDIADLSMYGIGSANNGGGTDGEEFTFPAVSVSAGTYIYVASESTMFTTFFGFAPDYVDGSMNINGDDAIELFYQGSVIDVFGDINTDGTGEPWEYMDGWAYRADNTGNDGSTFMLSNWMFSGPNALDNETSNATAATPIPVGTYSIQVASPTSVTLYANDGLGGIDSCTANVTVLDTVAPVVTCMDTVVILDATGMGTLTVGEVFASASDNCSVAGTMLSTTSFSCADLGANTVMLIAADASGNTGMCAATVTVMDTIAPTASNAVDTMVVCVGDAPAPDPAVITDAADECSVTVSYVSETITGNGCMDTIVRIYAVSDMGGNTINVTHTITTMDTVAPTASNPFPVSVSCTADIPNPSPSWVTDEADNCATPTVTWTGDVSDGQTCPETITRSFEVADACGNSITVTQTIVVNDDEVPVLDATALADVVGFCDLTPATPTASDNCAGTIDGVADVTFPINTLGTTVVTWTYTDACGNSVSQTQNVTVEAINVDTWIANDGITIVSDNLAADSYQWIDCTADTALTGETNHNFTPTYSSDFAVIVTQDGCSDTSDCVTVTEVGLESLNLGAFVMYPNPTTGVFTIDTDVQVKAISVVDMLGREVNAKIDVETKTVDGSNLVYGAYIVRVITENDQELIGTIQIRN